VETGYHAHQMCVGGAWSWWYRGPHDPHSYVGVRAVGLVEVALNGPEHECERDSVPW
jgi:hypothetical protein